MLVVDNLVHELLRQQNAESSGSHALGLAKPDMVDWVASWITHCGMGNFVERETIPGVADATGHHVASSDIADFHLLIRIKLATVLDGVEKHLPESHTNGMRLIFWQFSKFIQKLKNSVCRFHFATGKKSYPLRCSRNNVDPVIPTRFLDCQSDHGGQCVH